MFKSLSIAATLALGLLVSGPAAAIDFNFSFTNVGNGSGTATVTGIIRGLAEGTGNATSVEVLINGDGFGLGEFVGNPVVNSWTVTSGEITDFSFQSIGIFNSPPANTSDILQFESGRAGLAAGTGSVTLGDASNPVFTAVTAIPLPAAGWLLISALAGLAVARRRAALS